jgi:3-methyladenine DNA glycosylase AlkD
MKINSKNLIHEVSSFKNADKAAIFQRFFKTGKGEYGEGDIFYGISVPQSKMLAKRFVSIPSNELEALLTSNIHEIRFICLQIMVLKYQKFQNERDSIYKIYLRNARCINNWDLVDCSAYKIVGEHLLNGNRDILYELAHSKNLWEKRISIISTFRFIQNKEHRDTLKISEILLHDEHDLIHKAVGWMLREVGKRIGQEKEEIFLKKYYKAMPRTMLRYSLEHFPREMKDFYMGR